MGRKQKLPPHIYRRDESDVLYCWFFHRDGKKVKKSTGCTDPVAAAEKLAEWERDALDPKAALRRGATLGQAFDLLDEDRKALMKQGKRSEHSQEYYDAARAIVTRFAGRLIERVNVCDDELGIDRLKELSSIGERAALSTLGTPFIDGFITYRRGHGISENTIAKNRSATKGALYLAKRAGIWTGDLDEMFPRGFETGYEPRRVNVSHENAMRLVQHFDHLPHHRAQVAFVLATGAEEQAIVRALRADLDRVPIPIRGTKTQLRNRECFRALPWQDELLGIARQGFDGKGGLAFYPWHNSNRDLAAASEELGLPRLGLHMLRHIFGAWALDDGIDPYLVAMALGHRDVRQLLLTYDTRDGETLQRRALEQAQARARLRIIEGGKAKRRKAS